MNSISGRGNLPLILAAITGLLVSSNGTVLAQENRERASIVLGAFITDRDSTTRLDSDEGGGDGTEINLEDDLGLEGSTSVARLGGYFWFNERHRIDLSWFDLSRDASKQIQETIEFGDEIFSINTVLESESNLRIVKTDYTFAVMNRDRGYLGITGGLYVASTSLDLRVANAGIAEESDVTAPLPVFGVRGDYEITDRITLGGAYQIFRFEADDVEGRFSDFYVGADYRFTERFATGLAYNRVSMNLRAVDEGREGSLKWGYDGFMLYAKYDFGAR
jgi:hypothetical protein